MKKFLHTFLSVLPLFAAATLRGQAVGPSDFLPDAPPQTYKNVGIKYALILPDDKTAETVKTGERNPFGKNENELNLNSNKGTSQENMIREHLSMLKVSGFSPDGPNGIRVMLGDMALEEGQTVPTIIPDQTLNLKVSKITRQTITLVWIEKKNSTLPPRLLTLPVDLEPTVRYVLHGQLPAEKTVAKGKTKPVENNIAMGRQSRSAMTVYAAETESHKSTLPEKEETASATTGTSPKPVATPAPAPEAKAAQEPAKWNQALKMLNNLAKLEEAQN